MGEPLLRTAASGYGGSGYSIPTWLDADGRAENVPGVTTVTKAIGDADALIQWAVDNTAAYAVANLDVLAGKTEEQGWGFLRWYHKRSPDLDSSDLDVRNYHKGVLNDTAEAGTRVHDWIEADLLGEFTPEIINEPMAEMVDAYLRWKSEHTIEPILIEATAFNTDARYAGTLDLHAKIDGRPRLVDVKTARSTRAQHFAQLAALGACLSIMVQVDSNTPGAVLYKSKKWGETWWIEEPMPDFSEYGILHVRPTDYDRDGKMIKPFCEYKVVEHIDAYYDLFLAARQMKETEYKIRKLTK